MSDVKFFKTHPLIMSVSKDTTIRSWSASNYCCNRIYRGHSQPIWCINESPVGDFFATGSKDFTARLWCLERDFPILTFTGHSEDIEVSVFIIQMNSLKSIVPS